MCRYETVQFGLVFIILILAYDRYAAQKRLGALKEQLHAIEVRATDHDNAVDASLIKGSTRSTDRPANAYVENPLRHLLRVYKHDAQIDPAFAIRAR